MPSSELYFKKWKLLTSSLLLTTDGVTDISQMSSKRSPVELTGGLQIWVRNFLLDRKKQLKPNMTPVLRNLSLMRKMDPATSTPATEGLMSLPHLTICPSPSESKEMQWCKLLCPCVCLVSGQILVYKWDFRTSLLFIFSENYFCLNPRSSALNTNNMIGLS